MASSQQRRPFISVSHHLLNKKNSENRLQIFSDWITVSCGALNLFPTASATFRRRVSGRRCVIYFGGKKQKNKKTKTKKTSTFRILTTSGVSWFHLPIVLGRKYLLNWLVLHLYSRTFCWWYVICRTMVRYIAWKKKVIFTLYSSFARIYVRK